VSEGQSVDAPGAPGSKPRPAGKRAIVFVLGFLLLGGAGMLGGAYWSYHDDHTGTATKAKVTHCTKRGSGKGGSVYCTGNWAVGDHRVVDGDIQNAKYSDAGKTLSVRAHGNRAVVPALWVSIGLGVMGLAVTAVAVWLLILITRRNRRLSQG
jgi:hypothetical protein